MPHEMPHGARRVAIAALLVLTAMATILGAVRAAQSTPDGTPIPTCSGGNARGTVQPCHWDEP